MIAAQLGQKVIAPRLLDAEQGPLVSPGRRDHGSGDARTKPVAPAPSAEEGGCGQEGPVIRVRVAAASDPLAALLVALDLKHIVLSLAVDGTPRAKLPEGAVLDAETWTLLGANREAIVAHLHEQELWRLGRAAQLGDAVALAEFKDVLARYEALEASRDR